jgi:hypothetical protein
MYLNVFLCRSHKDQEINGMVWAGKLRFMLFFFTILKAVPYSEEDCFMAVFQSIHILVLCIKNVRTNRRASRKVTPVSC